MKLADHYDGSNDPLEGDRTLQWRSLPANALVSKATLTATPTKAVDGTLFQEVISFTIGQSDLGATKNKGSGFVEVDFHKRRTLASVTGPNVTKANLQVDIGGVYVEINANGAIKAPGDSLFPVPADGTLPSLTVNKIKLTPPATGSTGTPDVTSVTIRSVPSNLTVRLGNLPPVWTRLGELAAAERSPDFTATLQALLAGATVKDDFCQVAVVVHSDTVCRLDLDLEVEYVIQASLQPQGLKEVVLPFDYGTVPKTEPGVLSVAVPANALVVPRGTTARVKGAFDETRIVYGPTGEVTAVDGTNVSSAESQAQVLSLDSALAATAVDLLLTAVSRTAQLRLDLRGDLDGKPDVASLLSAPVEFSLDGTVAGQPAWVSVPLPAEFHFQDRTQQRYWVVLQSLDGEATWGLQAASPNAVPLQHTQDGGLSWHDTPSSKVAGALAAFLRLRDKPDRFQVPVDLQVGSGAQAIRVKLDRYQPLGRVDFALDASDVSGAFNQYAAKALPAACPEGQQLANADFEQWNVVGKDHGPTGTIPIPASPFFGVAVAPDGQWAYVPSAGISPDSVPLLNVVDVTCDDFKTSVQLHGLQSDTPQGIAIHPDGSRVYVLGQAQLDVIDGTTWTELGSLPLSAIADLKLNSTGDGFGSGLALSRDGSRLYVTTAGTTIVSLDTTKLEQVVTGQATLTQGDVNSFPLSGPAAGIALSPDGSSLYATIQKPSEIAVVDTATGRTFNIVTGNKPGAIAVTPDGNVVVVANTGDNTLSLIDTASRQASVIQLGGQPACVAISPDGGQAFVGTAQTTAAGRANSVTLVDLDRRAISGGPIPLADAPLAIAISPQGDRVYVVPVVPIGEITNLATSNPASVTYIPLGVRVPAEWSLTSGQVRLVCLHDLPPSGVAVVLGRPAGSKIVPDPTALSQVVPAGASCSYTFSFWGVARDTGAVAEVFWLGQDCRAARTDRVPIQVMKPSQRKVSLALHRAQLTAPAGATQAEVRFRSPAGVIAGIAKVSLQATSDLIADGDLQEQDEKGGLAQWTEPARASSQLLVTTGNGATLVRNPVRATAELVQTVNMNAGKAFTLRFRGRAVELTSPENHPSVEVHWLAKDGSEAGAKVSLEILPEDFEQHAASGTTPEGTAQAEVHLVLPGGTALAVERVSLAAQDLPSVPLSFVAQAPGEIRVSEASVGYDERPVAQAPVPAQGLCTPTPPGRQPGEPPGDSCFCPCCQDEQPLTQPTTAVSEAGRPLTVGRCANCGSEIVRGGGPRVATAPTISLPRLTIAGRAPAAAMERPMATALPALTTIPGIGAGRVGQLAAIGIKSVRDLAAATPDDVARAVRGVSVKNAAGYIQRARRILASFEQAVPMAVRLFAPQAEDPPAPGPTAPPASAPTPRPLTDVAGIGPGRARMLAGFGITSVEHLAQAAPKDVARALRRAGVSSANASTLVARARALVEPEKQA